MLVNVLGSKINLPIKPRQKPVKYGHGILGGALSQRLERWTLYASGVEKTLLVRREAHKKHASLQRLCLYNANLFHR